MNRRVVLLCMLGLLTMWLQPFLQGLGLDWFNKSKPPSRVSRSAGLRGYYENDGAVFYVEGRPAELQDFYEAYTSQLLPPCDARDSRIRYMTQTNERLRAGAASQSMLFQAYASDLTGNNKYAIAVAYAIQATHCTVIKKHNTISN